MKASRITVVGVAAASAVLVLSSPAFAHVTVNPEGTAAMDCLPESLAGDSWSQTNIAPFLPRPPSPYPAGNAGSSDQVLTALQSCASSGINGSPLVQTVTADDNITTALQQLFSTALPTARLVQ